MCVCMQDCTNGQFKLSGNMLHGIGIFARLGYKLELEQMKKLRSKVGLIYYCKTYPIIILFSEQSQYNTTNNIILMSNVLNVFILEYLLLVAILLNVFACSQTGTNRWSYMPYKVQQRRVVMCGGDGGRNVCRSKNMFCIY